MRGAQCPDERRSGARGGRIALSRGANQILLSVVDDGRGFDAGAREPSASETRGGYGLTSVRERLAVVGGSLDIRSDTGRWRDRR